MNTIVIAGTLGADADLKYTANGDPVANFSVACRTGYDKKASKEKSTWFRCTLFGKRAETLSPMLLKGGKVTVSGQIEERKYTDNEGNNRSAWEVSVHDVALQGSKLQGDGNADGQWNDRG